MTITPRVGMRATARPAPRPYCVPTGAIRALRALLSQRRVLQADYNRWRHRARSYLRAGGYAVAPGVTALRAALAADNAAGGDRPLDPRLPHPARGTKGQDANRQFQLTNLPCTRKRLFDAGCTVLSDGSKGGAGGLGFELAPLCLGLAALCWRRGGLSR